MTVDAYEFIVNAEVLAEDIDGALRILHERPWLNYQDDAGAQHGKLVYLFPEQRLTRVTGWGLIGTVFPLLRTEGEPFERYSVRAYGAALLVRMVSPNGGDAANYVVNRGWFNRSEGVEVRTASTPSPMGTFVPSLVGGIAESERMF